MNHTDFLLKAKVFSEIESCRDSTLRIIGSGGLKSVEGCLLKVDDLIKNYTIQEKNEYDNTILNALVVTSVRLNIQAKKLSGVEEKSELNKNILQFAYIGATQKEDALWQSVSDLRDFKNSDPGFDFVFSIVLLVLGIAGFIRLKKKNFLIGEKPKN
jgi:hypothetical protein